MSVAVIQSMEGRDLPQRTEPCKAARRSSNPRFEVDGSGFQLETGPMPFLKRDEVELYYELSGDGLPVLLIQGIGVTGEGWRPQVSGLPAEFQMLTFDNRGIGRSQPCRGPLSIETMAVDALTLMDAIGWKSAHLVGHSMGGVIAQQIALDCPERVRSLSLLCTFGRGKDAARPTPWVIWMSLRTRLGSRPMRRRAFLEMLFPQSYLKTVDQTELARKVGLIVGRDLSDNPSIMFKQVQALGRHNALSQLGKLGSIPTLVISGRHDPIAKPAYGRVLAAAIPGAVYEEWPDASHGLIIQQAEALNRRLKEFWMSSN
jgi:pimeloyl-ACP methyl ester carboxylesterase